MWRAILDAPCTMFESHRRQTFMWTIAFIVVMLVALLVVVPYEKRKR